MNNDKQQILIDCVNGFKEISRHERYGVNVKPRALDN